MAITPSQWSHVLTIPESYTPSAATSGQTLVITESVIAKLSAGDQTTFWSNVQNGGGDVRICTDSGGVNQLAIEVVSLDTVARTCVIWVRKPSYDGTGDLYVFVGKAGETQPPVTDPFGRNAVWQEYARRIHFDNDLISDSVGAEDFTNNNALAETGVIGGGVNFDNGTAYLKSQNTVLPSLSDGVVSAELWIDKKGDSNFSARILQLNDNSDGALVIANGGAGILIVKSGLVSVNLIDGVSFTAPSSGSFRLVVAFDVNQPETLDKYRVYVDGVQATLSTNGNAFGTPGTANDISLGARVNGQSSGVASIDEFGFFSGEKSPSKIATEYANQSDPASFFGTPTIAETSGATGVTADAAYTIASPAFSASADATQPQPIGDVSFTISAPTFASSAQPSLPQPVSDIAFNIAPPAFSSTASATLPQPISDAAFTINAPTFAATADATQPGYNASVNFTANAPTFSADAAATLPQPIADGNFTISAPTFSVVAIVGGIAIIVDNETNINVPALATNINAPVLSNNMRI